MGVTIDHVQDAWQIALMQVRDIQESGRAGTAAAHVRAMLRILENGTMEDMVAAIHHPKGLGGYAEKHLGMHMSEFDFIAKSKGGRKK